MVNIFASKVMMWLWHMFGFDRELDFTMSKVIQPVMDIRDAVMPMKIMIGSNSVTGVTSYELSGVRPNLGTYRYIYCVGINRESGTWTMSNIHWERTSSGNDYPVVTGASVTQIAFQNMGGLLISNDYRCKFTVDTHAVNGTARWIVFYREWIPRE